ncbi:ABC transporter substrate-binding protein [Bacillaceae bacterium SIJ1]|uniref:ABC transporter substrate-binding protein n=1 Tax=Litoribacterium kuwaitense TaxID=1398745 RepID=UPI0013ECCEFF|nr:ABC transporter substrate-binding protein [Litoribacterium kuwaitense]NGP44652.1 ABC transporter substrate-binding protein [Litoribacterium kuwaitense]
MKVTSYTTILLCMIILLAACQSQAIQGKNEPQSASKNEQSDADKATDAQAIDDQWTPRTVTFGEQTITLEEKPDNIAALSLDTAQAVLALTEPGRVVVASQSIDNEALSHFVNEAEQIDGRVKGATRLDPEEVLAFNPDLILLTTTHGAESDALQFFQEANIPTLTFDSWHTIDRIQEQLTVIAEAIGEEDKGQALIEGMEQTKDNIEQAEGSPSIMAVSQVGSTTGPYVLGPSSIAYDIISHVGGVSASDELGYDSSSPINIEQMLAVDPDYIILVNWGNVSDEFKNLIESPGWKTLTAVKQNRVIEMDAKDISSPNPFVMDTVKSLSQQLKEQEG